MGRKEKECLVKVPCGYAPQYVPCPLEPPKIDPQVLTVLFGSQKVGSKRSKVVGDSAPVVAPAVVAPAPPVVVTPPVAPLAVAPPVVVPVVAPAPAVVTPPVVAPAPPVVAPAPPAPPAVVTVPVPLFAPSSTNIVNAGVPLTQSEALRAIRTLEIVIDNSQKLGFATNSVGRVSQSFTQPLILEDPATTDLMPVVVAAVQSLAEEGARLHHRVIQLENEDLLKIA